MANLLLYRRKVCDDFIHRYFTIQSEIFIPELGVVLSLNDERISIREGPCGAGQSPIVHHYNPDIEPEMLEQLKREDPDVPPADPQVQHIQVSPDLISVVREIMQMKAAIALLEQKLAPLKDKLEEQKPEHTLD
jgi:hypothetical protein